MTMEFKKAKARVVLTLEIDIMDNWGENCSVKQVHDQAADGAIGMIRNWLDKNTELRQRIRVIGVPKVEAVIAIRENV